MTKEMENVINATEQHIVVQSFAGTGKSTTLLEYVKANPTKSILFMVFNREMKLDFEKRLKSIQHNCYVTTIHALAYRWYTQKFGKKALRNLSVIDIKNIANVKEFATASKIQFYLNMFLSSNHENVGEMSVLSSEDKYILRYVERVWSEISSTDINWTTHSVYLKLYELAKVNLQYDVILADELNDCNKVMLSLLINNLDKKIIASGDSNQRLMAFSHCVDGLNILKQDYGFTEYKLTMSFRVSEHVASLSSRYLTFMNDKDVKFNGAGDTKITTISIEKACSKEYQIHLLCRTKLGGLAELLMMFESGIYKTIYFVGGIDSFGMKELENMMKYKGTVYIGGQKFSIGELRKMVDEGVEDPEIARIISLSNFVRKNKEAIPLLRQYSVDRRDKADIVLLTSHVSKGLTLSNVMFANDFPPIEITKTNIQDVQSEHEYIRGLMDSEKNLVYVAMTRATNDMDLGNLLKKKQLREKEELQKYASFDEMLSETNVFLKNKKNNVK